MGGKREAVRTEHPKERDRHSEKSICTDVQRDRDLTGEFRCTCSVQEGLTPHQPSFHLLLPVPSLAGRHPQRHEQGLRGPGSPGVDAPGAQ